MAKLATERITQEDMERYLVAEDDFEFELKMLSICRQHCNEVSHAGTYRDPVTKFNRQYDFRTWISDGQNVLALSVECKNLKNSYPLLVSEVPRREDEAFHFSIVPGKVGAETRRHNDSKSMYPAGRFVGKSTNQVGKPFYKKDGPEFIDGDAEVYEKWSQAVASAADLVENASDYREPSGIAKIRGTIVVPVLVVPDETLWTVEYAETGERQGRPKITNACSLYLQKLYKFADQHGWGEYWISHLNIYTAQGFVEFLETAKRDLGQWF